MAKSTGPILAVGAITLANEVVLQGRGFNWRVPIATGIAALVLDGIEHVSEPLAVGIAWIALVAVLFTRIDPNTPAPIEALNDFISKGKGS
jgi:hypothetical protein